MTNEKRKPIQGNLGRIRYKIWTRESNEGRVRFDVQIYRSYRVEPKNGGDNGWRESSTFSLDDLKLLPLVVDEVNKHLASQQSD
jgi:hypothetical protein